MQEEDEVPDDETVNQMIARHEEEFDLFMVSGVGGAYHNLCWVTHGMGLLRGQLNVLELKWA